MFAVRIYIRLGALRWLNILHYVIVMINGPLVAATYCKLQWRIIGLLCSTPYIDDRPFST